VKAGVLGASREVPAPAAFALRLGVDQLEAGMAERAERCEHGELA
jgi:hypothetical protein